MRTPSTCFGHNGLRYDGNVYKLCPPLKCSVACRIDLVNDENVRVATADLLFDIGHGLDTYHVRDGKFRMPA